jgi:hypothetical protein
VPNDAGAMMSRGLKNRILALVRVHPEIGKIGRDQGVRKILPQASG